MSSAVLEVAKRYESVSQEKSGGATYTPKALADFVAGQIIDAADGVLSQKTPLRVLDPAVGEGELLASLLAHLPDNCDVQVYGFETNPDALRLTESRLRRSFPKASIRLVHGDFLDFVLEEYVGRIPGGLFASPATEPYDLVIANPPYVRTQIMGTDQAQRLARDFGLAGRVDLYHAFILGIARTLAPKGIAGIILSNRFMTTRSGASVRRAVLSDLRLRHVWDLGDTKLFDAAVLPAVILAEGAGGKPLDQPAFTSIYETSESAPRRTSSIIEALQSPGVTAVDDGRRFRVQHGHLDASGGSAGVWRIKTEATDAWLGKVVDRTWRTFGEIGKIRVGVKTCADSVFIGKHWGDVPKGERPELLRPLTTHHSARRFKALPLELDWQIVYPHESIDGKRQPVDLTRYPRTKAFLERHRETLEARRYVVEAGRQWYELWVPQDPAAWDAPKLVFRDISEHPCFWVDQEGRVVNGDCYWMTCDRREEEDLLWLAAAVANSSFIEAFYDHRFNNKLYSGRRRFITQYVEQFPLPDPTTDHGRSLIAAARASYETAGTGKSDELAAELDRSVWEAFGLRFEEISR